MTVVQQFVFFFVWVFPCLLLYLANDFLTVLAAQKVSCIVHYGLRCIIILFFGFSLSYFCGEKV